MLDQLQKMNVSLNIRHVEDSSFKNFGRILERFPDEDLIPLTEDLPVPESGNVYVPSEPALELKGLKSTIQKRYYGGMDIQIGYCNGNNSNLGGLEYHKGSEINVAATDMVLLLGHLNDMEESTFSTNHLKAFYIPKGYAIEMFQTTLHLAPCKVTGEGFKCIVILPEGTNTPLKDEEKGEDSLLFMRNKWLIAHEEHQRFVSQGAHVGIKGPNVFVQYLNDKEGGSQS